MNQIILHVIQVVLAAIVIKLLRLNTKRVVISQSKPISWVWKLMKLIGKFLFFYGLLVFITNFAFSGVEEENTAIGASIFAIGLLFWTWGESVIYFKRNK